MKSMLLLTAVAVAFRRISLAREMVSASCWRVDAGLSVGARYQERLMCKGTSGISSRTGEKWRASDCKLIASDQAAEAGCEMVCFKQNQLYSSTSAVRDPLTRSGKPSCLVRCRWYSLVSLPRPKALEARLPFRAWSRPHGTFPSARRAVCRPQSPAPVGQQFVSEAKFCAFCRKTTRRHSCPRRACRCCAWDRRWARHGLCFRC